MQEYDARHQAADAARASEHDDGMSDVERQCKDEIERYLLLPTLKLLKEPNERRDKNDKYNCPLEWWKVHQKKLPVLSDIAKCYLSIQATSAASERQFSVASKAITSLRNRTAPEMAGSQIYVKQNWKKYKKALEAIYENEVLH